MEGTAGAKALRYEPALSNSQAIIVTKEEWKVMGPGIKDRGQTQKQV